MTDNVSCAIAAQRLIAIVRGVGHNKIFDVAKALLEGGIKCYGNNL